MNKINELFFTLAIAVLTYIVLTIPTFFHVKYPIGLYIGIGIMSAIVSNVVNIIVKRKNL